jgi:hypothetical protein
MTHAPLLGPRGSASEVVSEVVSEVASEVTHLR